MLMRIDLNRERGEQGRQVWGSRLPAAHCCLALCSIPAAPGQDGSGTHGWPVALGSEPRQVTAEELPREPEPLSKEEPAKKPKRRRTTKSKRSHTLGCR